MAAQTLITAGEVLLDSQAGNGFPTAVICKQIGLIEPDFGEECLLRPKKYLKAFEAASGVGVPYKIVDRRAGDIAVCYSNPSKALAELGWQAQLGLEHMMADAWRWQKNNPDGYGG